MMGLKEIGEGIKLIQEKLKGRDLAIAMNRRDYIATHLLATCMDKGVSINHCIEKADSLIKELDKDVNI